MPRTCRAGAAGDFSSPAVLKTLPLLPVEEEGRLSDPALQQQFIERVFAYHRWQQALATTKSPRALVVQHYVKKYAEPYLARQFYLAPGSRDLMVRCMSRAP